MAPGLMGALLLTASGCGTSWSETEMDGYRLVTQENGATLGYSPTSGVKLLEADGFVFKDLNKNGKLDPYEDWRLSSEERANDLANPSPAPRPDSGPRLTTANLSTRVAPSLPTSRMPRRNS